MKSICILLGFLFISVTVFSQTVDWQDFSDETVVFKLSDKEALKLLKGHFRKKNWDRMLRTPFASFSGEWKECPKKGHFVFAEIKRNKVYYHYHPVIPFQVFLFKEYGVLTLQVVDLEGNIRDDAKVRLDNTFVHYDPDSQAYSSEDYSEEEKHILTVQLDEFRAIFDITKHLVPSWYDYGREEHDSPSFYSYLITDKNKYKPLETVRFKSYALSEYKRPLKKDLTLWLRTKGYDFKKILSLSPYHPGGFAGEFQLTDSLELELDRMYSMQLRDQRGRIVASTGFRYEDYELFGNKLQTELSTVCHYMSQQNQLKIMATDANGLALQEMEVEVTVCRKEILHSYVSMLSLPDTLMTHRVMLDAFGRGTVNIPSDLFGPADCSYEVKTLLLTPDNERIEQSNSAIFYYSNYELRCDTREDSLSFSFFDRGIETAVKAELIVDSETEVREIHLPYVGKFSQAVTGYNLKVPAYNYEEHILTAGLDNRLKLEGGIMEDSLIVSLTNPLKLDVSWYVYQGNQLLQKGAGKELDLHIGELDNKSVYYVEVFCFMGNEEQIVRRTYHFSPDHLVIKTNLPDRIYPGQAVDAALSVSGVNGDPISEADLTAFSVNSQLGYAVPDLPYYGQEPQAREQRASYSMERRKYDHSISLNYEYWNRLVHLERLPYYRFIYPSDKLSKFVVDTPDGITQMAPYVMKEGRSVNIYAIELNDVPCYFSWTEQPKAYSFRIPFELAKQKVTLRLADRAIVLDSMLFDKGKKTILSLDIDHIPAEAKVIWLRTVVDKYKRNIFTQQEQQRYSNYICRFPIPKHVEYACLEREAGGMCPIYLSYTSRNRNNLLVGPVEPGHWRYMDGGVTYRHEGGFAYEFEGNVVYKYPERVCPEYLSFSSTDEITNLSDFYFTPEVFGQFVDECRRQKAWHPQNIYIHGADKTLSVRLPVEKDSTGVANLLLLDCTDGNIVYPDTFALSERNNSRLPSGVYNAVLLYNNGKYLKYDSVSFHSYHSIDMDMSAVALHEKDSLSSRWLWLQKYLNAVRTTRPVYQRLQLSKTRWLGGNRIRGYVYSEEDGEPMIGASVVVKGTQNGTITDLDGYFELMCEHGSCVLQFSYIGMKTEEIAVSSNTELSVMMKNDVLMMDEVVVVGYGTSRKVNLVGSMCGITRVKNPSALVVPSEELPEEVDGNSKEAEQKLYNELMRLNGLRRNFSDVAFWEPELYTDKEGKARFSITFPDNITQWNTVIYAMNRKLQTGTYRHSIRSYKPLMAELKTPRFLTVGDKSDFIGTIRNYTKDKEIKGTNFFCIGPDTLMERTVTLKGEYSAKIPVQATATDSITTRYLFTRNDGYEDGEERTIPVVLQGTELSEGALCILQKGTAVEVEPGQGEEIQVTLTGNQLDNYVSAIDYLGGYRYLCNEQLASKLIGLLGQKKIACYKGEVFTKEKEIVKIIRRLIDNQNDKQIWGWWGRTEASSSWMSGHILKALKMAADDGYTVDLKLQKLEAEYAHVQPFRKMELKDIEMLYALRSWGIRQDYAAVFRLLYPLVHELEMKEDSLKKIHKFYRQKSYLKEKLLLWEMQQPQVSVADSLRKYLKEDALGGVYCVGEEGEPYYSNHSRLENTLIAYRMIKNEPSLQHLKVPMQWHILYTRSGGWNTYQASSAIAAVFDDLLGEQTQRGISAIVELKGKENCQLTEFPYNIRLTSGERLSLIQTEGVPLIFSTSTTKRVMTENIGEAFEVHSAFEGGDHLTAGVPVSLAVTLDVKQDGAEYVMLEVPIPASCSYTSKPNHYWGPEVHREYFKEKTVIFCEKLPIGKYVFHIPLLPRFTGTYSLNPAKVELMYFPIVNANNNMRSIQVIDRKAE
ncbi:carboxypeptidase-like regulatory domain-containing protein [Bacteroides sp.]